jgi:hypothetical protein
MVVNAWRPRRFILIHLQNCRRPSSNVQQSLSVRQWLDDAPCPGRGFKIDSRASKIAGDENRFAMRAKEDSMPEQTLRGSCLCKSVRYEVTTPFMRFGHCYCSRCRKATGGVRSTNIAVPIAQFRWTQGENLIKRYDLPEAKSFARQICGNCNCPVPHASRDGTRAVVPAGTLDDVPPGKPAAHGHWSSRVSWVEIDESELPCTD